MLNLYLLKKNIKIMDLGLMQNKEFKMYLYY